MGRGPILPTKTRGPSLALGARRHRSTSTPLIMGRGPGRPVKTRGPPHGLGRVAHIKPASHGTLPDPAHQISSRWASTRPGPSTFRIMGHGPAQPIDFSNDGPRPGPARPITFSKLSARLGPAHHIFKLSAWPGPALPGPPSTRDKSWYLYSVD